MRGRARTAGIGLALVFRVLMLLGITWIIGFTQPLFTILEHTVTGRDSVLFLGGLFLLYKSTTEIHHKLDGGGYDEQTAESKKGISLTSAIIQITLINIVFSIDSILTAVGLTNNLKVMIIPVVISILIMMAFAGRVGTFVNRNPSIEMLGLAFLILMGFLLIAEGAHLSHVKIAGAEIGVVPKGYLYFAIAFSLFVEMLNMRLRKKSDDPVELHGIHKEAKEEGIID